MEKPDNEKREAASSGSLREAIGQARLEEAQAIDAALDARSTELARLEILKGALEKTFDDIPAGDDRFCLTLVPSQPARLWIDMFSYVDMDADGERYRFVRNERDGRRVLAETGDPGVIKGRITEYIARQIVARERQLAGLAETPRQARRRPRRRRLRVGLVVSAFLIGILTGVVGLFAIGWLITQ